MATPSKQPPLYLHIRDSIRRRYAQGEFKPGDRFYSIEEIKKLYNVSAITAVKALDELKRTGLVRSVQGKGSFFQGVADSVDILGDQDALPDTEGLVIYSHCAKIFGGSDFQAEIFGGIEAAARDAGLSLRIEYTPSEHAGHPDGFDPQVKASEGLIYIGPGVPRAIYPLIVDTSIPSVVVDAAFPLVDSVATDNLQGMASLLDLLAAHGHRHVLNGTWHPRSPSATNENERTAAFEFLVRDRGLRGEVMRAGEVEEILARVRRADGPTAVLFNQDHPAHDFCDRAVAEGLEVPGDVSVCGFDGFLVEREDSHSLTTIEVDRVGLGRTAVEAILAQRVSPLARPLSRRIPGTLRVGQTTGAAPGRG